MRVWLGRSLIALSVVLLGFWIWVAIDARKVQNDLAHRLVTFGSSLRPASPRPLARATRHEAGTTGLVGRIEIPRLRLSAMILEGTTERALLHGVGHVEHTAFPGEHGNVALAGHRDTYFRSLKGVERGDTIRVRTPDGQFTYRVESVLIVKPTRTDLLAPTRDPTLTLVTCYPFHWIGPAPDRFIIQARQAGTVGNPQAWRPVPRPQAQHANRRRILPREPERRAQGPARGGYTSSRRWL